VIRSSELKQRPPVKRHTTVRRAPSQIEAVAGILREYGSRGVFRGFSREPDRGGQARFKELERLINLIEG
jgi:hypothetical protein